MTRKVCVVVTARPSYSRIKTALIAISRHAGLELQLVLAASALLDRYGRVEDQIRNDGFDVAARVFMVLEGENPTSMAKTTGIGLLELATVMDNLRPDLVVTVADRFETMATATAAAFMGIPLAHVQGGEVTGSIDERVRHAVTKLSDIHFPSTRQAGDRLIRMGERPERVFVTGCPSIDLAAEVAGSQALDHDPFGQYGGVGELLNLEEGYIVVMQHPVTTEYTHARHQVLEVLHAVDDSGLNALWFWPNVDAGSDGTSSGIRGFRESNPQARMHFFRNMAPQDFLRLLIHSLGIVGNSSVAIRECEFLGVPAVDIGTRQSGRERGANVITAGYHRSEIQNAILTQAKHGRFESGHLYGDGLAGQRIAKLLAEVELTADKRLAY